MELLGGEQYACLIRCFLNPDLMVSKVELVTMSLPHVPKRELDAVYELFHPSYMDTLSKFCLCTSKWLNEQHLKYKQYVIQSNVLKLFSAGPSDLELRHAIANIIAAVLGTPEKSTHLWLHMFSPSDLDGTYMTGFMVRVQWDIS